MVWQRRLSFDPRPLVAAFWMVKVTAGANVADLYQYPPGE
jgi:hypothetical protein